MALKTTKTRGTFAYQFGSFGNPVHFVDSVGPLLLLGDSQCQHCQLSEILCLLDIGDSFGKLAVVILHSGTLLVRLELLLNGSQL